MPILEIKELSVTFGGVQALSQVNLSIGQGEIRGLIGPNGAGKSTLFNAITGVVKPSTGTVLFEGSDITGLNLHQVALSGVSRTYQNLRLFNDMTVLDNVIVGGLCGRKPRFWGSLLCTRRTRLEDKSIREKAEFLLESLGLSEIKSAQVRGLPYRKRKAVELTRALATKPKVLLLDEPSAGMNFEETEAIIRILKQINKEGYTIFVVEHDMRVIMGLSDRISVLDFGQKIAEGAPGEISRNERVIKAYLGH